MNKDLHTDPGGPSGIHEDLLVKFLLGETSPDDNARVEAWLAADPANRHFYNHFQLIWRESRRLNDNFNGTDEQTDLAWQKFRERVRRPSLQAIKGAHEHEQLPTRAVRTTWTKVAAALLLVASITAVFYLTRSAGPDKLVASTTAPLTDTLPDGSFVTLNKQSDIRYPANFKKQRTIHLLKGEAFFKIAPDKAKPFKVYAGNISITVLGTSFNVRNEGDTTEITVESGLIRVTDSLHDVLVHPSEKLILHHGNNAMTKASVSGHLYKYYTKEFICDNTPLWQLAASLEKAYDTTIVIDPSLRQLKINTIFRNQSVEQILNIIQETFNIRVTHAEGKIILQP
ncbi:MAG TPA: FecR domain-containing protein [Puia sp.]|nr:FecR domain-containing protein [Puia sp.]